MSNAENSLNLHPKTIIMKKYVFLFLAGVVLSCQPEQENSDGNFSSKLSQGGDEEIVNIDENAGYTTLSFNKMEHDFGNVQVGQEYTYKFVVKNTGKKPLIIEDAKASCGCTVPDKPENPIAPGKSDEIVVKFSPKPGQGVTSKTVTIMANTEPKITTLTIRANVIEDMTKGSNSLSVE